MFGTQTNVLKKIILDKLLARVLWHVRRVWFTVRDIMGQKHGRKLTEVSKEQDRRIRRIAKENSKVLAGLDDSSEYVY